MEAVLLDTDVFSFLWQDRPEAAPYRPLVAGRLVVLSFTSVAEAHNGARRRRWGERRMAELEAALSPLSGAAVQPRAGGLVGGLRADLEAQGVATGANDLWIAATALRYGLPFITHNRRHFERVPGLHLRPE
jgi:predicted nucleic acid-binding protein